MLSSSTYQRCAILVYNLKNINLPLFGQKPLRLQDLGGLLKHGVGFGVLVNTCKGVRHQRDVQVQTDDRR